MDLSRSLLMIHLAVQCTIVSSSWLYLGQDALNNRNFNDKQLSTTAATSNNNNNNTNAVTDSNNHHNVNNNHNHHNNNNFHNTCRQQSQLLGNKVDACSHGNGELMEAIVRGSAMGLLECQWQFRLERWNCNMLGADNDALDDILLQGTREIAFLHAATSASLVHSITSSCSAGLINDCTCDQSGHVITSADEGWQWGGCSDNIDIGVKMSQAIIDHVVDDVIVVSDVTTPAAMTTAVRTSSGKPPRLTKSRIRARIPANTTSDDFAGFHGDLTTSAIASTRSRRTPEGNYVINLRGSSKVKRIRRDDVTRGKSGEEKTKKSESGEDLSKKMKNLINLHNNEVGRKTISSMMSHACRCHGVSGSCAVRTCWKALPDFRKVGDQLKLKYESSVEISPLPVADAQKKTSGQLRRSIDPSQISMTLGLPHLNSVGVGSSGRFPFYLKRREKRKSREPVTDSELVFVKKSPNYCRQNPKKGVWGTKGRRCDRATNKANSCQALCCGRGYLTTVVRRREKCDCKFVWCCEVVCRECEVVEEVHTCK